MSATAQPVLVINDPAKVAEHLYRLQKPDFDAMLLRVEEKLTKSDPLSKYAGAELSLANVKEIMGGVCDNTAKKRLAKLGVERIGGKNRYDKEVFRKAYFGK